jgi:DNA-directed RNA polymerase specialized sigma24 family protein
MNPDPRNAATASDRECLRAFSRLRSADAFHPVVERYLPLVYSSALRRTGDPRKAAEASLAVFLVLARRARRLSQRKALAGWLFHVTRITCRKLGAPRPRGRLARMFRRRSVQPSSFAAEIDEAVYRLRPKLRDLVLLCGTLGHEPPEAAGLLRIREARARKRWARGLRHISRHLRKCGMTLDPQAVASACRAETLVPITDGLANDIRTAIAEGKGRRPALKLARRTLSSLAWMRWRRRVVIGIPCLIVFVMALGGLAWHVDGRTGHSRLITAYLVWSVRNEARTVPGLTQPARPWRPAGTDTPSAAAVRSGQDIYRGTNIWPAHLSFSRAAWKQLEPKRITPLANFLQPDGTVLLRHPEASRSGLAGVLGWDFQWTHADLELGGRLFTNVAARFKGNGTYLSSLHGHKRPFKVDLNEFVKGQKLGGADELNFHNLIDDRSCMSDSLAYEFFRDAGVPAPRTAYAYLSVTVEGKWTRKPLGLYAMVQPIDEEFAREHFGSKKTVIFKPVTYELFRHLGDDWSAYEAIYDPKKPLTAPQQRRIIELARLVTYADDAEFERRIGEFIDVHAFARFLAGEVLLSAYDSFLSNGQNFYMYLDPRSNKVGFIPWDMDLAWGGFFLLGTTRQREQASIWHPWVGEHRFVERMLNVPEFRELYRARLEEFLAQLFIPERLHRRVNELSAAIREAVAAESDFRLGHFDEAVSDRATPRPDRPKPYGADRPVHQLKPFIVNRVKSVRDQLDGAAKGKILRR